MGDGASSGAEGVRAWYLARSALLVLGVTTAAALFGGLLLWFATELSFPFLGLLGVVVATGAAWVTTDYTAGRWRRPGSRAWRTFVVVAAILGLIGVVVADVVRSPLLAFIGLMALTFGIGPFVGEIRDDAADVAERWMEAGLLVGLASSVVIGLPVPNLARLVAFVILLVGFGLFTGGLSTLCARGALPHSRLLRIIPGDARQRGLIVGAIGLTILLVGLGLRWWTVVTVGAWSTIVAMIMLSVKPARFGMTTLMKRSVLVAGVVLVGVAGYQLYITGTFGRSAWFVAFIVATIALAGAWIVWRGATLFIGVVLGFIFVWGLISHSTPDPHHVSTVAAGGDRAAAGVVAFGDSFISGEGAPEFYEGTDQKGADRNECRRAPTAYPVLISLDADGAANDDDRMAESLSSPGLDFLACSGAKLRDVLDLSTDDPASDPANEAVVDAAVEPADTGDAQTEQPGADGEMGDRRSMLECEVSPERSLGQYPCGPDGVYGAQLQLDELADARDPTELVLLSIGGNDVRFGDIVSGCLLPGSCAERREIWLDNVAALGPELTEAYTRIRQAFPDDVAIVVMPYPLVLTEDTCADSPLDASEHEFIFEFTTVLNRQIAVAAAQAGVHFFEDGAFALQGHRLCESDDRAVNLIRLQPTDGPVFDRLNPGSWTHNSMHPNPLGHRMIAERLGAWLDAERIVVSGNPEPADTSAAPLLDVRVARPFAVSPTVVEDLRTSGSGECDFEQIDSFATRVAVFDERPTDGSPPEAFRVPVAGADTAATVCVTDSTGAWMPLTPEVNERGRQSMTRLPSAAPVAEVVDDRLFVTGGRPDDRCLESHPADRCEFQWILFSAAADEPGAAMSDRSWNLRAVRYCTTDPDCADTFGEWTAGQIRQAGRRVGATIGLIFFGGWLVALGIALLGGRRLVARLHPGVAGDDGDIASPHAG